MKKVLLCVFVLAALLLSACGSSAEPVATLEPVPAEYAGQTNPFGPEAASAGEAIFKMNCESCHGPQGHGDGPVGASLDPKPKNLAEFQAVASDDFLFWRINTGKAGTSMVAWKGILTDEQMWQVISFLHTLK